MAFRHFFHGKGQSLFLQSLKLTPARQFLHSQSRLTNISTQKTSLSLIKKRFLSTENRKGFSAKGPVSWASLAVFILTGGGIVAYVRYEKEQKAIAKEKELKKSVGKAAIGGPFELVDTKGKTITDKDFHGSWLLLYFGFCHCPDICPDQLEKLSTVVEKIEKLPNLPNIQPVFITVDPHRDTVETVKEYIKEFHPRMMGLTGTEEQVKKACKAYRVYYSVGPKDEDEDYIVDHTIITYLIGPDGRFIEYFGQNREIDEIVGSISTRMALSRKRNS